MMLSSGCSMLFGMIKGGKRLMGAGFVGGFGVIFALEMVRFLQADLRELTID